VVLSIAHGELEPTVIEVSVLQHSIDCLGEIESIEELSGPQ
jgi:hypothetical protein